MRLSSTSVAAVVAVASLALAAPAGAEPTVEYVQLLDGPNASIRVSDVAHDPVTGRTVVAWYDPDIFGIRVAMVDAEGELTVGPVDIPNTGLEPLSIERSPAGWLLANVDVTATETRLVTRFLTDQDLRVFSPNVAVSLSTNWFVDNPELVYLPGAGNYLAVFRASSPLRDGGRSEMIASVPLSTFGAPIGRDRQVFGEVRQTAGDRRLGPPSVGVGPDGRSALVAAHGDLDSLGLPVGDLEVAARVVSADGRHTGPLTQLSENARDEHFRPDASSVSAFGDGYLVAYRDESRAPVARVVDAAGSPADTGEQPLLPAIDDALLLDIAADGAGGAIAAVTPADGTLSDNGRVQRLTLEGSTVVPDGAATSMVGDVDAVAGDTNRVVWSFIDGGTPTLGIRTDP